jgi:hypothetical protein
MCLLGSILPRGMLKVHLRPVWLERSSGPNSLGLKSGFDWKCIAILFFQFVTQIDYRKDPVFFGLICSVVN